MSITHFAIFLFSNFCFISLLLQFAYRFYFYNKFHFVRHGKIDFVKVPKNLARYRSENNFV